MDRLRRGERCWPAELGLRSAGLVLLGLAIFVWRAGCRLAGAPAHHPATPLEFAVAAAFCVFLSLGLALTIEGTGLLKLVPLPPRALI